MIGIITESIYGIIQVTYDVTGDGKWSTYGTEDENPDSLMIICWYLLLEVH